MTERGTIGIVGLGIMGMAFARNLLAAGYRVIGVDPATAAREDLLAAGGAVVETPLEIAEAADCVLVSLASTSALDAVVSGPENLCIGLREGQLVIEMGTLPLEAKEAARRAIEKVGAHMVDCPVSGTGAQAANRDLVVFASGDSAAIEKARPVLETIARDVRHVGPFGVGIKLKYVANLLVAIHNVAAAEALLLAERSGLDPGFALEAVAGGAGGSRMLEVRGPLMTRESYEPATMKIEVFQKDLDLIRQHAEAVDSPLPLLEACLPVYQKAMEQGRGKQDTAAVFSVLKSPGEDGR